MYQEYHAHPLMEAMAHALLDANYHFKMNSFNLLTRDEVASILNVSRGTVDNLHRNGVLPRVKITSRTIRYKRSDLDRLIEARRAY